VRMLGGENDRRERPPFRLAFVLLAAAFIVVTGVFLVIFVPLLQDWRAFLVFALLPTITVALVLVAALKP
jgi:hypothetical protein